MVAKWNYSGVSTRLCGLYIITDLDGVVCPSLDFVPRIDEGLDRRGIDVRSGNTT